MYDVIYVLIIVEDYELLLGINWMIYNYYFGKSLKEYREFLKFIIKILM